MPTSLSARIALINKQNGYSAEAEQKEKQSEENLVSTIEQTWADAKAFDTEVTTETQTVDDVPTETPKVVTNAMLYDKIEEMMGVVTKMQDDIVKINKHINATQKMLKKAKEKK